MNAENTAQRLQETAAKCLNSLDAWNKDLKDNEARNTLLESVHELRKVTSRLEIDIAMNDRKALNARPIPVPEHKSKIDRKKDQKPLSEILPVAEIKEAGRKRKIAIEEAKTNNNSDDAVNNDHDNGDANDAKNQQNAEKEPEKKQRRPRRKKVED